MSETLKAETEVLDQHGSLREVAALFLKVGCIAFGGARCSYPLMRDEVVKRRKWISERHFLDLLGVTNLIPGANSTEMAIHLGFTRAGWPSLITAGALFILPAMLIVLAFAYVYVEYGHRRPPGYYMASSRLSSPSSPKLCTVYHELRSRVFSPAP